MELHTYNVKDILDTQPDKEFIPHGKKRSYNLYTALYTAL
jgi:hypothetical protein